MLPWFVGFSTPAFQDFLRQDFVHEHNLAQQIGMMKTPSLVQDFVY